MLQKGVDMDYRIGALLKRIDTALGRQANAQLASVGLTLTQVSVLGLLADAPNEGLAQKQIEQELDVSHPTTTGLVKRLGEKGLVAVYESPDDARMKIVRLTAKGREAAREGETHRAKAERALTEGFTDNELAQLKSYLSRIIDNLG